MSSGTSTANESSGHELTMDYLAAPPSLATSVSSSSPVPLRDTEDLSTWLQAAFLASHSPLAANASDLPTSETCGQQPLNACAWFDRDSHCWRMSQTSFLVDISEPFSQTWPQQGMTQNGLFYQLAQLAPHTHENGCSYWPTPTASEGLGGGSAAIGERAEKRMKRASGHNIARRVHDIFKFRYGKPAQPKFYEWLMGIPIGATGLQPVAMDKFRLWLQQHGGY